MIKMSEIMKFGWVLEVGVVSILLFSMGFLEEAHLGCLLRIFFVENMSVVNPTHIAIILLKG